MGTERPSAGETERNVAGRTMSVAVTARLGSEGLMSTKATAVAEIADAKNEQQDAPLLDALGAGIKRMIARGKERGYVTYDELNSALPPEQVSSEQIEDTMAMLSEIGINVIEGEESDEGAPPPEDRRGRHARRQRRRERDRPHRRSGADVPARDGQRRAAVARGRDRHRQADRGRPRDDDRRHLRKPADHARASSAGTRR